MPVVGRFAPTPSGPLHFGSLVAALASYCQCRQQAGRWLLRIEDVDTPRVIQGASDRIIRDLESFGFEWDGRISYQSDHFDRYQSVLDQLGESGLLYACQCSRRQLKKQAASSGPLGLIYPGNCRMLDLPWTDHALRLDTSSSGLTCFDDGYYGHCDIHLAKLIGDPVLRRADGIYAYHLAVVVDDENEGITQIVRGADLVFNTCIHLYLQAILGYRKPAYFHVPLVNNDQGVKLSKQTGAEPLDLRRRSELLVEALKHLGQPVIDGMSAMPPREILLLAVQNWDDQAIRAIVRRGSANPVDH